MKRSFRPRPYGRSVPSMPTLGDLTRELLDFATESSQTLMRDVVSIGQRVPTMRLPQQRRVCDCDCDEPQMPDCCQVDCHAYRGERVRVPIRVVNHSDATAQLVLTATPWQRAVGDSPQAVVELEPTAVSLQPNQAAIVMATVEITQEFSPGSTYRAEVAVQSRQRQDRICLTLLILADDQTACEIVYRPRVQRSHHCHHWCDHFYCQRQATHTRV